MVALVGCYHSNPYQKQQEELAQKSGVSIGDYPYPISFPEGYYFSVLEKGMSLDEIHSVITDYQTVFHCDDYAEIYYYFDTRDDKALRFRVFIDPENKTFERLQGEDDDSRTININGCDEGVLK
jgi:hypothetical protein